MPPPSEHEIEVFNVALELPVQERPAYLDRACAGDAALRQRVEELLQASEESCPCLEGPVAGSPEPGGTIRINPTPAEKAGDRIGRYKLLQQIGEGGCGVVYMAEQEEPVHRRVALKVIKLGMDTKQVIARFEAERQALALMDHPNIAKVLDAGATDTGRPYFVMELVRGIKITDYCDQNNLSTRERLDLFVQVCRAIQHAHQKGIIHRDIKPSNILVTMNDGVPLPKVIDFGIAKATHGKLTDQTLFTAFEQFIGTPAYMSPEQAEMSALDIDTRSDIYSLGVLLYELLTGQTPFNAEKLLQAGLDEIRRTIREEEPARPSTRLSTMLGADLTAIARHRNAEPPRLIHLVQGDLDWIVMKALEKDRTRRYETANGLAADVERHLKNEPVVACPPSNLYRFQKLVRRNKLAFAAAAAIATVLLLGVMVSTSEAIRARQAEREQIQLRQQAEADETKARTEAAKATAISDFLQQSLQSANPDQMKGSDYTVRQLLDDYSVGLENQFRDQPEVEAAVRATLGQTYYRLGLTDKSQAQLEQALVLRRRIFGANELVAATLVDYAWTSFDKQQFAKGESQAREALDIYRKRGTVGRPVIAALWVLQEILNAQGRYTEVESVSEEALDLANKTPVVEYPETASVIHGLAQAELSLSKYSEAEALSRKAVEMHRRLHGTQHPETGWALLALGRALLDEKKLDEAEGASREALSIFRKQYTFGHKSVDNAMSELKDVLVAKGDLPGLVTLYQVTLAEQRAALGNDSPAVAETLMNLSDVLQSQGKQAEAENASREALDINLKGNGPITANLPALVQRQAQVLFEQGKSPEAEKLFEQAINDAHLKLGETNLILGELLHDYAGFFEQEGNLNAAAEYYLKSLPIRRARQDDNLAWTLRNLGGDLNQIGRPQEAERYLRESLALYHRLHQQEDISATGWAGAALGSSLWLQHKLPEAEQAYRDALAIYTKLGAVGSEGYAAVVQSLLDVLKAENKLAEGEALCRELLAQQRAGLTNDSPAVAQTMSSLADNLAAQGRRAEAEKALREALRMFQQSAGTNSASSDDLTKLGHLQWQLGQMLTDSQQSGEAEQLFENALQVFKKASQDFPREPYLRQEQAFSHRLLGHLMESPGRWDESASHYRAAVSLYAALVADDPKSSFYLSEQSYTIWMLALALDQAGQTNQAAEKFQRAVTLHQKGMTDFPDEDVFKSRGITVRVSQADFLLRMKRYGEAEQAYRDALQICANSKAAGGEECLHTARALAEVLRLENKPAEAESLMNQAIAQQQQSSGEPKAAMVAALINLADFLKSENKLEETAGRLREATDILLKLPGEELSTLPDQTVSWMIHEGPQPQARNICDKVLSEASTNAGWLNGISWNLVQTEPPTAWDATLAVELAKKAVLVTDRKDASFLDTLAAANAAAGRFTNAVVVAQEAIALTQSEDVKKYYASLVKLYQSNTPYRDHGLLAEHTLALLEQGKFAQAEPLARECLKLREIMIPDDWRTFNARSMLGGSLLGQKKYAEAEPLLLSGYEGLKQRADKIPTAGSMRPQQALQRLLQLYEATGRPNQAAEWKKKLPESDQTAAGK